MWGGGGQNQCFSRRKTEVHYGGGGLKNAPTPQILTFRSGGGGGGLGVLPVTVDCESSPSTILSVSSSYTASSASESRASGSSDIDDTVLDRSHLLLKMSFVPFPVVYESSSFRLSLKNVVRKDFATSFTWR